MILATETSRSSLRKDDAAEHAVRSSGGQLARRHSFDAGRDSNATNSFSTVKQNHLADRERARASSAPRLLSSSIVKPTEASLAWFPYKDDNIIDRTSYHLKDVPPISSGFNPDRPAWKPSKSYRSLKNTMSSKTTVKKNKPAVATYNSQGGNMVTHALTSTTALNISKNDKTASSESKSESNNRQNISTFSKKATPSIISARYIGDDCSVITVSTIASDFLTKNSAVSVTNYSRTSDGGFNR